MRFSEHFTIRDVSWGEGDSLTGTVTLSFSRYFSRAFTIWSKQNKFTPTFLNNLISHTEAEHAAGAWLLLSMVVPSSPKMQFDKILGAWDNMIRWERRPFFKNLARELPAWFGQKLFDFSSKDISVTTCCHILCVMGDIAAHLNEDTKIRIVGQWWSLSVVGTGWKWRSLPLSVQAIWCHGWRVLRYPWRSSVLPWRLSVNWGTVTTSSRLRLELLCFCHHSGMGGREHFQPVWCSHYHSQTWFSVPFYSAFSEHTLWGTGVCMWRVPR